MATANEAVTKPIQKSVFDLDTFKEVTLVKEFSFTPVTTTAEAMAAVGNDSEKFLSVINKGLEYLRRKEIASDPTGYRTFKLDETGEETGEVNGEFTGTIADVKAVNALVLTLAKTVHGYNKDMKIEDKRKAKESAMEMIRGSQVIRDGLKKSAALAIEAEE